MAGATDIGSGVVVRVADLREIAAQIDAVKQIFRRGPIPRDVAIALERRCKSVDELLRRYLQLRLQFSPTCPTCGADVAHRRY